MFAYTRTATGDANDVFSAGITTSKAWGMALVECTNASSLELQQNEGNGTTAIPASNNSDAVESGRLIFICPVGDGVSAGLPAGGYTSLYNQSSNFGGIRCDAKESVGTGTISDGVFNSFRYI